MIVLTVLGIVRPLSPVHPSKADPPIDLNPSFKVSDVRPVQSSNVELPIDTHSEGFKLITRIQDEAHRFAIEYHRSLRSKAQTHSVLDEIKGIGPARRKALLRAFGSAEAVRDAGLDQLAHAPSMDARSARNVWDFFHPIFEVFFGF